MGLKFLDKVSAGKPANGDIPERELVLNLKDNEIYSSTDGNNIVLLAGSPEVSELGGMAWSPSKSYIVGTLVTIETTLPGGTPTYKEYISLTDNNLGNDPVSDETNWRIYNVVKWIYQDIEITVGPGGDFSRLDDALHEVHKYRSIHGSVITVRILSGHVIDYDCTIKGVYSPYTVIVQDDQWLDVEIQNITVENEKIKPIQFINCVIDSINLRLRAVGNFPTGSTRVDLLNFYRSNMSIVDSEFDLTGVNFNAGEGGFKTIYLTDGSKVMIDRSNFTANNIGGQYFYRSHFDCYASTMRIDDCDINEGNVVFSHASIGTIGSSTFLSDRAYLLCQTGAKTYMYNTSIDLDTENVRVRYGGIASVAGISNADGNIGFNEIDALGIIFYSSTYNGDN